MGVAASWHEGGALRSVYYPTRHEGGFNLPESQVQSWLSDAVRGRHVKNLNTRFDCHFSRSPGWTDWRDLAASLGDVGHYAALLDDHRKRFSLEAISQDLLGEGKVQGLDMQHGAGVYPAWMVTPYARQDTALVMRLWGLMEPLLNEQDLRRVVALEDALIPAVVEMEMHGIPLDVEKLARWERESGVDLERTTNELNTLVGWPMNVNAGADVERLCLSRGHETTEKTEKGAPSYSDRVLAGFKDPVIAKLREVVHLSDLRSKFITAYSKAVGRDGVMRYSLNQLRSDEGGTVSGRFSSSALAAGERGGVNIQQIYSTENQKARTGDRWIIRELFVAPPGRLFFGADAEQIEFRLFAHYAHATSILRAYEQDPHTDFHQIVTDIARQHQPDVTRKLCKNASFAIIFGAGVAKTAEMLGMSEAKAKAFLRVYNQAFPEAKRLARAATKKAERRGYVFTALGRRARFPGSERVHKALNSIVQGSAADYHKLKLVALYRERRRLGFTIRATVHDEIVGDVADEASAHAVASFLDAPAPEMPLDVPLLWSAGTGTSWREAK